MSDKIQNSKKGKSSKSKEKNHPEPSKETKVVNESDHDNDHEHDHNECVKKNAIEKTRPKTSPIYLVKLLFKLSLCVYITYLIYNEIDSCDNDLNFLVKATNIILIAESVLLSFFLLSKYLSKHCMNTSSYCVACYLFFDILMYIFYLIWGAYYIFEYIDEEECSGESIYWLYAQGFLLAYFILFDSTILCCVFFKSCLVISSRFTSSNMKEENLTNSLLSDEKKHE